MKPDAIAIPLWRQLQTTALVIGAVRSGVSGTAALDDVNSALKPGVQALSFHVWRKLGRAEALRDLLVQRRPTPKTDAILCVALALLWDDRHQTYDSFTLVNQTVEAIKRSNGLAPQANFVNACLRRFLRERSALVAQTDSNLVARWNHPLWWIQRLQHQRPNDWENLLEAANAHAPMTLRANVRNVEPAEYLAVLDAHGISATLHDGGAIVLGSPVPVQMLPGFALGHVSVQDSAAQRAAPLLLSMFGGARQLRVLDACAAPGGKTGHLLELIDGDVTALEIDAERAKKITENLQRLGLRANVLTADAVRLNDWWDGELFDAILLDAPCTASGITRRHPDVRWLRRSTDVGQLARQQQELLQTLWATLKPGGRLVYCTCSIFEEEGTQQVQTFLANNTHAALLPSPGHLMPQNGAKTPLLNDNQPGDHDGFFYALFEKRLA
ncbi:MAG: 16S rRNA (cytosine(967)-C(5))-methyltransferase [Burkholderiales bacterium PBB3]|nr:MAG: 16S rRNA (cytosine(967)-C(5))-methyltransferase [Burkholderiales bacterium PBB3]